MFEVVLYFDPRFIIGHERTLVEEHRHNRAFSLRLNAGSFQFICILCHRSLLFTITDIIHFCYCYEKIVYVELKEGFSEYISVVRGI